MVQSLAVLTQFFFFLPLVKLQDLWGRTGLHQDTLLLTLSTPPTFPSLAPPHQGLLSPCQGGILTWTKEQRVPSSEDQSGRVFILQFFQQPKISGGSFQGRILNMRFSNINPPASLEPLTLADCWGADQDLCQSDFKWWKLDIFSKCENKCNINVKALFTIIRISIY